MLIIDYVIKHKSFMWLLVAVTAIAGIFSYFELGRLEYPNFKIKTATITTLYPGATAKQVETEVTEKVEEEVQKMAQVDYIKSLSQNGMSLVYVYIKAKYTGEEIPQIWDELRRKANDVRPSLPSGVTNMVVGDDFGDVYGIYFALSGKGYTIDELKSYADSLKKELLRVPQVAKIAYWGVPTKAIYVEFNRTKLSNLNISQKALFGTLSSSNTITSAGAVKIDDEYSRIRVTGAIDNVESIKNLYVSDNRGNLFKIGDIAEVKRGHVEPESQIMYYNGEPAIGFGISAVENGNVVKMGNDVKAKLAALNDSMPVGMQINYINFQANDVQESINSFNVNFVESVLIVIGVLLIFMGWRSGVVIGLILILIILGTFIVMYFFGIELQLISLGALIIALGMLVDNAIVVVDGYLVKTSRGRDPETALKEIADENQWALLGATLVAIGAFMAIGLNEGNIGEFCKSLFYVIAISLLLSWVMALTFTPLFCLAMIPPQKPTEGSGDVYDGKFYKAFEKSLKFCLDNRYTVVFLFILALVVSCVKFGDVPSSFMPNSTRKQFVVDYWRSQGSHIDETKKDVLEISKFIRTIPGVTNACSCIGAGTLRFMLTYNGAGPSGGYGQIIVDVEDYKLMDDITAKVYEYIKNNYPSSDSQVMKFGIGASNPFKIEVRFRGPDSKVLRELAEKAKTIFRKTENALYVRDDWRYPVKSVQLKFSEVKGRRIGVTRSDFASAVNWNFSGETAGVLRENNELIPIISRPIEAERKSITELNNVLVWSSSTGKSYPVSQVSDGIETVFEDYQIYKRDRMPTITVQCTPAKGTAAEFRNAVLEELEALEIPEFYSMDWGGEFESSGEATAKLKTMFPISVVIMFIIIAALFTTLKDVWAAFAVLPFSIIGVTFGLLAVDKSFGFMAILGFLGLAGMLLKNAIVLIDQANLEMANGASRYKAIIMSAVSRMRPVAMGAGTTILGVAPLISDAFFDAMAATIVFGLLGGTILTLYVVPLAYAILFNAREDSVKIEK
jgi:multidrug efflux pump subunit AcrB